MATIQTFTTADQKNAEGEVVDKIFTITKEETEVKVSQQTLSGTEVAEKIKVLESKQSILVKETLDLQEQINFLKALK